MKRDMRNGLMAFCFASVLVGAAVTDAGAQNVLSEVLRRMDLYNKSTQSLIADVTMVKHNPQLNVTDTTVGRTSYLPKSPKNNNKMYVRVDWVKPVEEQISVIGDKYELYRPRLNQVIKGTVQRAKNSATFGGALSFMNMSREQLRASYNIKYLGEEQVPGGPLAWHLELTPKVGASYRSAELWVNADGMPVQSKIFENNGDWTSVVLTNVQRNVKIKGDIFRLKVPRSVKIVPN